MLSAASANPASYSKRTPAFRAAVGYRPAARARLGSPSLVGLYIRCPVPAGFVAEHRAERRPACIKNGFCHPRLGELGRIHITDDDQLVFASDPGGLLVKVVAPRVGDLGVDRASANLVPGTLGDGKSSFISTIVPQGWDHGSVATSCQYLEAQIYSDLSSSGWQDIFHLALEANIPASARVLNEGANLEVASGLSGFPEVVSALEVGDGGAVNLYSADAEGNPAKAFLVRSESRAPTNGIPARDELAADGPHGVAMDSKLGRAATTAKPYKIKRRRPPLVPLHGVPLNFAAVVPHPIARMGVPDQMPAHGCVLDAEFVCEKQAAGLRSGASEWGSRTRRASQALGGFAVCTKLASNPQPIPPSGVRVLGGAHQRVELGHMLRVEHVALAHEGEDADAVGLEAFAHPLNLDAHDMVGIVGAAIGSIGVDGVG